MVRCQKAVSGTVFSALAASGIAGRSAPERPQVRSSFPSKLFGWTLSGGFVIHLQAVEADLQNGAVHNLFATRRNQGIRTEFHLDGPRDRSVAGRV